MVQKTLITPFFGPGSGWYQAGQCSPGSAADRAGMRLAALPCSVFVLRRRGQRLPAETLLREPPPSGWLVCMDRYTTPKWYACLFSDEGMTRETLRLLHAQLEREHDGVRLYGGIEVDAQGRQEWRQSWLCTPTPERGREILLQMADQQGGAV